MSAFQTSGEVDRQGVVQAVHLDTGFYDAHYQPGAYLETHARHMERWH